MLLAAIGAYAMLKLVQPGKSDQERVEERLLGRDVRARLPQPMGQSEVADRVVINDLNEPRYWVPSGLTDEQAHGKVLLNRPLTAEENAERIYRATEAYRSVNGFMLPPYNKYMNSRKLHWERQPPLSHPGMPTMEVGRSPGADLTGPLYDPHPESAPGILQGRSALGHRDAREVLSSMPEPKVAS